MHVAGIVRVPDLLAAFDTVFSDPAWSGDFNVMIVYERDALLGNLTLDEVREVHDDSDGRIQQSPPGRRIKSALVYSREDQRTLLELHSLAGNHPQLEERVFGTPEAARAWLRT